MTPDGILTAKIGSIGQPQANKNGKLFRKVEFQFPSTGKTMEEGIFEFNFTPPRGNLANLKVGDTIETKLDDKGWPVFKIITSGEGPSTASQSNFNQVKSERVASQAITKGNAEQEEKSIAISLQGFMQQILPVLRQKTAAPDEMVVKEALDLAVLAREACLKKAKEIHAGVVELPPIPDIPYESDVDPDLLPF